LYLYFDRKGYQIADIDAAIAENASCEEEINTITAKEQQIVLHELQKQEQVQSRYSRDDAQ